jgi:hypothetical protein
MKQSFQFLFFLLFFSSCFELAEVDFPLVESEVKPVVFCIITPGDSIFAQFSLTASMIDQDSIQQLQPSDISVSIYSDYSELRLVCLNENELLYGNSQKDFKILPNCTYLLKATVKGHVIEAQTTVPEKTVIFLEKSFSEKEYRQNGVVQKVNIGLSWQGYHVNNGFVIDIENSWEHVSYRFKDTIEHSIFRHPSISFVATKYLNFSFWENIDIYEDAFKEKITYNLLITDYNLKRYFEMAMLLKETEDDAHNENFMMLFKGVLPQFTNINGGYGVFGSYLWCDKFIYEYLKKESSDE